MQRFGMKRRCKECGSEITGRGMTGLCKPCWGVTLGETYGPLYGKVYGAEVGKHYGPIYGPIYGPDAGKAAQAIRKSRKRIGHANAGAGMKARAFLNKLKVKP